VIITVVVASGFIAVNAPVGETGTGYSVSTNTAGIDSYRYQKNSLLPAPIRCTHLVYVCGKQSSSVLTAHIKERSSACLPLSVAVTHMHCTLITLDTPVLCFWCRPKTNTCLHRCSYLLSSSNNSWYRYRYSAQSRPKVSVSEVSVNYDIFFVSHVTWRNVLSGYFSISVALVLVFFLVGITLLLTSVACNSTTFHTEHC